MSYDMLKAVNEKFNAYPYKADPANFDDWSPANEMGSDCDSYAVAKLRKLIEAGIPIEAQRLALCYVETGEYHAVLIVETAEGAWMLDNRQHFPVPVLEIAALGYKPDRIQEFGGSPDWVEWKSNEEIKT